MMKNIWTLSLACLPLSLAAAPWNNVIEAGYSKSSGNSNVETLYIAGESHYQADLYGADARIKMDRQASNGNTTKEYYLAEGKAKRFMSSMRDFYLFGSGQWEKDKPAGLNSSWSLTLGPGRRWYLPHKQAINGEIGIGYQHSDYLDNTRDYDGVVGRLYADYTLPLNGAVTFRADTLSLLDAQRHLNTTNLKLESRLMKRLALGAGFEYRYNSRPSAGKQAEDTTLRLTLKYTF